MKSAANAADVEEKRSDDEKRGKRPLLLKRSVHMTKSAVKHHKEAYKWWKMRGNATVIEGKLSNDEKREKKTTVSIEEKRSSDEKRRKSEEDSARKSTWRKAI